MTRHWTTTPDPARTRAKVPRDGRAVLAGAAAALADLPDVLVRLRAAHVAGPDGRCVGCGSAARLAPRWPCRLATLARMATELRSPRDGAARGGR